VKPDFKPQAETVTETRSRVPGGRERDPYGGGLLGDLSLEGLDADQMDDLEGVTEKFRQPRWIFLLKMKFQTVEKTP
jgi:hypothetical protein